jgi:hypothetical protein
MPLHDVAASVNAPLFDQHDVFGSTAALADMAVRVDCGTEDGFIGAARAFAKRLPHPNLGSFTPGLHDDPYWRSIAPAQLTTIAAALGA